MKKLAEIMVNGPKGQSFATVEVRGDGKIEPWAAEAALAHALNLYNELPCTYQAAAFGKDDFEINPNCLKQGA